MSKAISVFTGPIFTIFVTKWKVFAQILSIRISFFDSSRDVAMATNWSQKIGVFYGPIYFVALPFGNGLQYCNFDFKRLDKMNFSTLFTILVAFGSETTEFTLLTVAPFAAIQQKSAYHGKYLIISWTYLDLLYRFGRRNSGDDFPNIRFVAAQGTLLIWQPVKYGRRSQTSRGTTCTLCFGIRQRIGQS